MRCFGLEYLISLWLTLNSRLCLVSHLCAVLLTLDKWNKDELYRSMHINYMTVAILKITFINRNHLETKVKEYRNYST